MKTRIFFCFLVAWLSVSIFAANPEIQVVDSAKIGNISLYYIRALTSPIFNGRVDPNVCEDSLVKVRYAQYDRADFLKRFKIKAEAAACFINSLNHAYPALPPVSVVYIVSGKDWYKTDCYFDGSIFVSSGEFFMDDTLSIGRLLYVLAHEWGHSLYDYVSKDWEAGFAFHLLWYFCKLNDSFHFFEDRLYTNDWGGHPQDHPSELFASAFNILNFHSQEFGRWEELSSMKIYQIEAVTAIIKFFLYHGFLRQEVWSKRKDSKYSNSPE